MVNHRRAIVAAIAVLLTTGACSSSGGGAPTPAPPQGNCAPGQLPTRTTGKLTVATADPAAAPWFQENRPESGEGFEAAVAYAVAKELGYDQAAVTWARVPTEAALATGEKPFDIAVNQYGMSRQAGGTVDMSAPYYLVRQAVVTLKTTKIADANGNADLRGARLGARANSVGLQAITQLIEPTTKPQTFRADEQLTAALRAGSLDGIVVDLPVAFRLRTQLPGSLIVGQVAQVGAPEAYGLVMAKDSPLTDCVSRAVGRLRDAGTLAELERRWLTADARELG